MTTPSKPAAPAEELIPPEAQTSQPGTPPAQTEGQAEENQQAQPQYVTKEELDQITADIVRRVKQSDRDRSKKIEMELGEIKGLLESSGVSLAPDQEAKIRNQIVDRIDGDDQPQQQGQSAAPQQAGDPSPVDSFLADIFAETGTTVTPNDPEWKDIQKSLDDNWNNPKGMPKVLLATTRAVEAKKARTAAMQETAAARVGGGGSQPPGNAPAQGSARDMLSEAFKTS